MTTWFVFVKDSVEASSPCLAQSTNLFPSFLGGTGLRVAEIAWSNQIRFSKMSRLKFLLF